MPEYAGIIKIDVVSGKTPFGDQTRFLHVLFVVQQPVHVRFQAEGIGMRHVDDVPGMGNDKTAVSGGGELHRLVGVHGRVTGLGQGKKWQQQQQQQQEKGFPHRFSFYDDLTFVRPFAPSPATLVGQAFCPRPLQHER